MAKGEPAVDYNKTRQITINSRSALANRGDTGIIHVSIGHLRGFACRKDLSVLFAHLSAVPPWASRFPLGNSSVVTARCEFRWIADAQRRSFVARVVANILFSSVCLEDLISNEY